MKHTQQTIEKIRNSKYHKNLKGTKLGKLNPMYGSKMSDDKKAIFNFKGRHHSSKTKYKQRLSAIKYIKESRGNISPNIGKHEKDILNEIEKQLNIKIIRQYFINGYFVDGYCKENNTVYEIDERIKNKPREIERENYIKNKLKCDFCRINDDR